MGRILLADDHPLFREALRAAIRQFRRGVDVVEADSLASALAALEENPDIDLILLDLKLLDCEGFTGLVTLRNARPEARVAVVSASDDAATITNALACGAAGFIPKSMAAPRLREALEAILAGETWTPPGYEPSAPGQEVNLIASLSPAQLRILLGLRRGLLNKQIAHEIGVTEATVKAHLTALFRKLGVVNRTQALIVAQALDVEAAPLR